MRLIILTSIAAYLALPKTAFAENGGNAWSFSGAGNVTCGKFAKDYAAMGEVVENAYFGWAQGFISGSNMDRLVRHEAYKDLNSLSSDEQKAEIRAYCDAHPLAEYIQAVITLMGKLTEKHTPP